MLPEGASRGWRWILPVPGDLLGRLLDLALVDVRVGSLGDDVPALGDPPVEEEVDLPERGLEVEGRERRGGVLGDYHVVPPQRGARGGVVDADAGDRAADDERVHAPQPQEMVEVRPVEGIVADLADDELVLARRELVHDPPAPALLAGVLGPDLPLRVPVVVRVLGEDDLRAGLAGQFQKTPYRRYRIFGVGDDER